MISCEVGLKPRAKMRVQASSVSPGEKVLLSLKPASISEQSEFSFRQEVQDLRDSIVAERRSECDRSDD